ncbi:hypothetical protein PSTG_05619 [Puccinia striiformis f. sp. tritici PST-78]|uniref:Uncharacterized protein n=1 Tax=Puccinia striiformis f. sp. tritici PST-78 TaxID=1165861 RepID=A0A0L0VPX5_9BASI|nr:hypothetical protein PSTG_05619 [Puccinia striiformis f. sp. tritici PST-78]
MDITQDSDEENARVKKNASPVLKRTPNMESTTLLSTSTIWSLVRVKMNPVQVRYATRSGAKLPLTAKEILAKSVADTQGAMKKFVWTAKYDTKTSNQIIVMWLICNSLPWSPIEDLVLRVAFTYVRQGVKLNSRVWAVTEAHRLYCNLQGQVIHMLNNLGSKVTLIHDVWTTKGNRHAFMGISAAYVTADWQFKIVHLGLKYIAWTHKGSFLAIPFVWRY